MFYVVVKLVAFTARVWWTFPSQAGFGLRSDAGTKFHREYRYTCLHSTLRPQRRDWMMRERRRQLTAQAGGLRRDQTGRLMKSKTGTAPVYTIIVRRRNPQRHRGCVDACGHGPDNGRRCLIGED